MGKPNADVKAGIPRIESLKVENYRALHKVELNHLTPMTVLLGHRVGKAITDLPSHTTVHTAPYTAVRHIQTSHAHALLSE